MRGGWASKFVALFCLVIVAPQAYGVDSKAASISIDASSSVSRRISDTLFGIFFEEINHAGVGGLWSELVMNRGFEAGGQHSPSEINPWEVIGDEDSISVTTDLSSSFEKNKVALRMDVLCDEDSCPNGAVGIYNPGFGGMNIEEGKKYKVTLYARSSGPLDLSISFTGADQKQVLDTTSFLADDSDAKDWTKMETTLVAKATSRNSSLQITTNKKGTIWIDQVSAMPDDTYMGHGFRKDLMQMLLNLKPRFLRFPGGCFVEGAILKNAFRWKETIGPWEERPGHYGDVWDYWTDDGLGYLEFLQLAEDLGAEPVWVINVGIAHNEQVNTSLVDPFVQELLDSLEFAMGDTSSQWGSLRAKYGHPKPFDIKYVAVGNEDCWSKYTMYKGNYLKFYHAIKANYPYIQVINNCDATSQKLDVPADLFDFHIYTNPDNMFSKAHQFDNQPRSGPKVFVSEYAVTDPRETNGKGTLIGALSEAGFLIGLERNSDVVSMASYAPLLMHRNDPRWKPDAINFDSWQAFGIPSYWMQTFFTDSSGATLLNVNQSTNDHFISSAISYKSSEDGKNYIKVKVVNFQSSYANVSISLNGVDSKSIKGSKVTVLTSNDPYDSNTFENPTKVIPKSSSLEMDGNEWNVILKPYSLTALDLLNMSEEGGKVQKSPQTNQTSNHGRFAKMRKQLRSKYSN